MNSFCPPSAPAAPQVAVGSSQRRGALRAGERVLLSDERGHLNVICLAPGGQFHTHKGYLDHDQIIGCAEGSRITGSQGLQYHVFRPLLSNFVQSMPRGAAVIYPKDAGQIVTMADIFPGARVVEAGVGSGALSISLLRAVGDHGYLHSIERRQEFADIARGNVQSLFGQAHPAWRITLGDLQEQVLKHEAPGSIDRVVLDMLAPWECLDAVAQVLVPGGVWISYVATVTQLSRTAEAIRADGRFTEPQAWESMVREWHLEGLAVRPEHRMIAHTGFLLMTRRFADGAGPLSSVGQKKTFADEDLDAWLALESTKRPTSGRKLRRAARSAAEGTALAQDDPGT
ncbi:MULTISPECIES: tRNA (adenine-N1)-methyltransferase [Pseudomonas]|uniref:tRNA (adenine-N1)-methyltransferase n=1 Tax=Pseudomonas TaxID=286 RepID=UPI0020C0585B|nr:MULTISPECIES: tRNA (adenine-N1)-methyltransferase [Pseudomonas]MCP6697548.1 tRNA (adenine-N1)-methyltransferase [Pseudomonas donghuensis]